MITAKEAQEVAARAEAEFKEERETVRYTENMLAELGGK